MNIHRVGCAKVSIYSNIKTSFEPVVVRVRYTEIDVMQGGPDTTTLRIRKGDKTVSLYVPGYPKGRRYYRGEL